MAAISSNGTGGGNWSVGASWAGGVSPVAGDTWTIVTGDTITADASITTGNDGATDGVIQTGATLYFTRAAGTYTFEHRGGISCAGTLNCGTSTEFGATNDPLPTGCNWTFRYGFLAGSTLRQMVATATASRIYFCGDGRKRWTRFTRDVDPATPNKLYVADATGWQVGDILGLEDTHNFTHPANTFYVGSLAGDSTIRTEVATISSLTDLGGGEWEITLTANVVNFNADPSRNAHHLRGVCANLSSNLKLEGIHPTAPRVQVTTLPATFNVTSPVICIKSCHSRLGTNASGAILDGHNSATSFGYVNPFYLEGIAFYDWREIAWGNNNTKTRMTLKNCVQWGTASSGSWAQTGNGSLVGFEDCVLLNKGAGSVFQTSSVSSILADRCILSEQNNVTNFTGLGQNAKTIINDCEFRSYDLSFTMFAGAPAEFNRCTFSLDRAQDSVFGVGYPSWQTAGQYGVNTRTVMVLNNCRVSTRTGQFSRLIFSLLGDIGLGEWLSGLDKPDRAPIFARITYSGVNGDPDYQRIITPVGYIKKANSNAPLLNGASPLSALRFEPRSLGAPLTNTWKLFAKANTSIIVTAKVYKSSGTETDPDRGGLIANYTGLTPVFRAIGTQNSATGTVTGANGAWIDFSLVYTSTLPDDEIITLSFECQSVQGAVWVTNLSSPLPFALDTGPQQWWTDGAPVPYVVSNYSVPSDVWNVLTTSLTGAGTIGKALYKAIRLILGS